MNQEKMKKIGTNIFVIILFHYCYIFKYIPILLLNINIELIKDDKKTLLLLSLFASLVFTIILLFIYKKELIEEFKSIKKDFLKKIDIGLTCWAIGLVCMIACNLFLQHVLNSGGAKNENAIQSYINILPWMMGLDVCIIAPFTEEIVFRKTLKNIFKNQYIFIISSFLMFGLAHVIYSATTWTDWLYIIPYGSLGAAFAIAYQKTDSIYTSMIFHMTHNTLLFLLSLFI